MFRQFTWRFSCYSLAATLIAATVGSAHAAIMGTPGLTNVRVWETTGVTTGFNVGPNGTPITTKLGVGVLSPTTNDFTGAAGEHYDVFYSDVNGTFNVNGDYVTVEAIYPGSGPGLNLAAVDLTISSSTVRADILGSFVGLGPNFVPSSVANAVDLDFPIPSTTTRMGNTVTPPTQHLRVTVGFSRIIPEPSSAVLTLCASSGAVVMSRRRRK